MLLGPEDGEQFRDPRMNRSQAVQAGVAGGTDANQQIGIAVPAPPMVDMKNAGIPTAGIEKRPGSGPIPGFRRSNPSNAGGRGSTSSRGPRQRGFVHRRRRRAASAGISSRCQPAGGVSDRW
jgi:hypothetical protein